MARATRGPRPPVSAMFISKPDRLEVGPLDKFEVGRVYLIPPRSFDRWVNLGRARLATGEEAAGQLAAEEKAPVAPNGAPDSPGAPEKGEKQIDLEEAIAGANVPSPAAALLARMETDPALKNFMAFRVEAQKILGDATPQKKVEIVEALKAKAAA